MNVSATGCLQPFIQTHAKVLERVAICIETLAVGSVYRNKLRRQVQHLSQLCLLLPRLFFGSLAMSDVGYSSDKLNVARIIAMRVSSDVDVFDRPAGHKQTKLFVEVSTRRRALNDPMCKSEVVRMYALLQHFQGWLCGRIEFENTIGFLRPDNLSITRLPSETPRLADSLCLRQVCFLTS